MNEKRAFVRCDFDVPLVDARGPALGFPPAHSASSGQASAKNAVYPELDRRIGSPSSSVTPRESVVSSQKLAVADETRLVSSIGTIEYLLDRGATVIAAGHIGRPNPVYSIQNTVYSLLPVAEWFAEEFPGSSLIKTELDGFSAWQIKRNLFVLENLRFYKEEEENSSEFAVALADLADLYVNEAFGSSHRAHASIVGVPKLLPHFAGFHLSKEIKILSSLLQNPRRPLTIIVGGAKIETKLQLISSMHRFADYVLIGGKLADEDKILIKEQHEDITSKKALLLVADNSPEKTDITRISLENFIQVVLRSKCVVWNGPMGFVEKGMDESSLKLAEAIIASSAYKVVGGGDTIGLLNKHGLLDKFDFASSGGGAMLEFLSGQSLPGIIALQN